MQITFTKEMLKEIPKAKKESLGLRDEHMGYREELYLSTVGLSADILKTLVELLQTNCPKAKGSKTACAGLKKQITILEDKKWPKANGAKQMANMLEMWIASYAAPHYRLYQDIEGRWYPFYVKSVKYIPEENRHGDYIPARCLVNFEFAAFGQRQGTSISAETSECRGRTPEQFLSQRGFYLEDAKSKMEYSTGLKKYKLLAGKIGLQCKATGIAFQDYRYSSHRSKSNTACVVRGEKVDTGVGGPSLVVIDVFDDEETSVKNRRGHLEVLGANNDYWKELTSRLEKRGKTKSLELTRSDDSLLDFDIEEVEVGEDEVIKETDLLPVHPMIPCFDLNKHDVYCCNVLNLEVYVYDKTRASKLILDQESKDLVSLLATSKGDDFKDVVAGKSGGINILLCGPPGTGKTLTAEIFAEATESPLYRVQCSQLGLDAEVIEAEIRQVFKRAKRWGAITLLDEADVYISERGSDIERNAIVGVFLRVLEYQDTVLFMTSNLPESIDDAIASRCIALISYKVPEEEKLVEIWKVLSENAGIKISKETIASACRDFPMVGRDVKNILKLMLQRTHGREVTIEDIRLAAKFHPNRNSWLAKK